MKNNLMQWLKELKVVAEKIDMTDTADGYPLPWEFESEVTDANIINWHSLVGPDDMSAPRGYSATRNVAEGTGAVLMLLKHAIEIREQDLSEIDVIIAERDQLKKQLADIKEAEEKANREMVEWDAQVEAEYRKREKLRNDKISQDLSDMLNFGRE